MNLFARLLLETRIVVLFSAARCIFSSSKLCKQSGIFASIDVVTLGSRNVGSSLGTFLLSQIYWLPLSFEHPQVRGNPRLDDKDYKVSPRREQALDQSDEARYHVRRLQTHCPHIRK